MFKEFGMLVLSQGHNGIHYVARFKLTLDNINKILDWHANYRVPGDLDHAYDFLTNPERKNEPNLYIGSSEGHFGDEEEYFLLRPEHVGGNDGLEETSNSNGSSIYSDN